MQVKVNFGKSSIILGEVAPAESLDASNWPAEAKQVLYHHFLPTVYRRSLSALSHFR